ncbi:MAG: HI0074 family nucleotidyltransferase substrate-binding subunit [Armatimonadota bacterium]
MTDEKLDLSSFRDTIYSLQQSLEIVSDETWFSRQTDAIRNTIITGVIQNFEFVYEFSVKMIRRQLEIEAASSDEAAQADFRALLRLAGESGLIDDVEAWFEYRKLRNITAHTYDREKAHLVCEGSYSFLAAARRFYNTLESRNAR